MLRVHFTADDLTRVRVAAAPDPLWEITNSFQLLISKDAPLLFGQWRKLVRPRMGRAHSLLAALLPPRGYSPDFLTPDLQGFFDLASAVETVLGTPRFRLRRDLALLAASTHRLHPMPPSTRALAEGEPAALRRLGAALQAQHHSALAPFWNQIWAQVDADRAIRARSVLDGGTDGLLEGFRPVLRWHPPILEADYPVERNVYLSGRGLLLQPSFFCLRRPVTVADDTLTPVLVYPIEHTLGWALQSTGAEGDASLAALIGRTRAAILENVVMGATTGELAMRLGVSGAAVSQHTAVLRQAGLLVSVRRGRYVLHTGTATGLALLDGVRPSV
ncbi:MULTISPECIES: ArsR/SmtB family transcription factor [unclassified Streptomyces]|uniref:ArsR/SmtB family transcription factor n=1 Tax=unclassified Streptomyces TaxID=2593676 RepID=UPI00074972CE|nr:MULTISPECIES: helix-turn-helix domain-containing protein [unclassified Streptomyces]KUL76244.1 ArsR family transcriptional regulator [Streptomyces sp. NRRL WC-3604]KUL78872.1 ArsR family transcriptional regulator [Streptomyces sp. NRRL WC-3605]